MQDALVELFHSYIRIAIVLSILLNIVINVLGFIPSIFLTAANLTVFGLWGGIAISFVGEVLGTTIAFFLYRKGFRTLKNKKGFSHVKIQKLLNTKGIEAFLLIVALRILPFMPSGLVTFVASIGVVNFPTFFFASMIGKIPAILIEGFSVYQVVQMELEWQIISICIAGILFFYVTKKMAFFSKNNIEKDR